MPLDQWLDNATPADMEALARALLGGRIPEQPSAAALQLSGFAEGALDLLDELLDADPKHMAWMLSRIARERRKAEDRYARVAQLVWSGASEDGGGIRDTRIVLDDLFGRAERHVLLATYVIYDGAIVFRQLAERVRHIPSLKLDFYVNLPSSTGAAEDEHADVQRFLETFKAQHWPSDVPLPMIHFDPATRRLGPERSSLHAKCVVVDERWAFITSANFTEAAQERNIETGVLLDHRPIAEALVGRFRGLRERGRLRSMNP